MTGWSDDNSTRGKGGGALAYLHATYILAFWQFRLFQPGTPSSKCVHSLTRLEDVALVHQIAAYTISSKFRRSQSYFWLSAIFCQVRCKLLIINQLNGKKGKTRGHKDLWGLPQNCAYTLFEEQVSLADDLRWNLFTIGTQALAKLWSLPLSSFTKATPKL